MAEDRLDRMERLFKAALLHPPSEQPGFLEAACPDDPELRDEILSLLKADQAAEQKEFLDAPLSSLSGLDQYLSDGKEESDQRFVGKEIGPYRVLRFIGHGGMGDVYYAVREEPFRQYVALKIIRRGMDTREVTRRFEMERQILASLNHPNIGGIYDGGVTDDGLPYFAMEFVDGVPITNFCDSRSMSIEERLRLFQYVCRAAHHAHQNLVIHRDLKPSNILVTGQSVPKLLDFGIAKLVNPNLGPADAPVTRTEIRAMTPEYASPEQAEGESLTTVSDVYSLGVILYELLAGQRPYYFRKKTSEEIRSVLYEYEPERPSSVVTSVRERAKGGKTAPPIEIGEKRGMTPERLRKRLAGDLDNIVLMAMRKEPERRYASAEQLADDIDRYLEGAPVIAHRDSPGYRLRKYVGRHRIQTIATVIIALLLIVGSAVTIYQANQIANERDRAQLEADRAEQVAAFLVSLFEASDPSYAPGDTLTARELLENGAERIETELADQPTIQASLYEVIGTAYASLGLNGPAEMVLQKSLAIRREHASEEAELATTLKSLGDVYVLLGEYGKARGYFEETLEIHERTIAPTEPAYLTNIFQLGTAAHFEGDHKTADTLFNRWETLYEQVEDREDPELAEATFGMSRVLFARKDFVGAEKYLETVIRVMVREHGEIHAHVTSARVFMASIQLGLANEREAEELLTRSLKDLNQLYPEGHREIASVHQVLATIYNKQGKYDQAEASHEKALSLWENSSFRNELELSLSRATAADFYLKRGKFERAIEYFRQSEKVVGDQIGTNSIVTIRLRISLAESLIGIGEKREARAMLEQDLVTLLKDRDEEDEHVIQVRALLEKSA